MRNILFTVAAAILFGFGGLCDAQEIFGIVNSPNTTDELIVFDASDPAGFTVIGKTGIDIDVIFTGLEFAGPGGGLFGYAAFGDPADSGLYEINTSTGAATPVGELGGAELFDLSWDRVTNTLFGIDAIGDLYEIDIVTGSQNNLGPIAGLPTVVTTGLAHDEFGTLFVQDVATDAIYSGTQSGVSLLHSLPFNANFNQGITIDNEGDGTGYYSAFNSGSSEAELYSFSGTPGDINLIGSFVTSSTFSFWDLAIRTSAVPEPSSAIGILFALAGALMLRCRDSRFHA